MTQHVSLNFLALIFYSGVTHILSEGCSQTSSTHLDDLDGLFDLLQFLGSLLDQVFELRPLLTKITLREQTQECGF